MASPNLELIKNRFKSVFSIDSQPDSTLSKERVRITGNYIRKHLPKGLLIFGLFLVAWFLFAILPVTYEDWTYKFRLAALHLHDPYYRPNTIFNPPWIFPFLYPIAVLPHPAGAGLLMLISVVAVALYAHSPKKTVFIVFSAPMVGLFTLGQLDALLLFGLMIPGGLGLPILLAKPQGVFLTALRRINRWSLLVIALTFVISILVWGFWWNSIIEHSPNPQGNMSLFPYTIIAGIGLIFFGLKRDSDAILCLASLCFAPYFMIHSALPAVAGLIREADDWRWWVATVLGSWLYFLAMKGFLW